MNYIIGEDRTQMKIESIDSYVNEDNEVRVIDKIVDVMDIESLGFNVGKNDTVGRPKFNARDILKLYIYGYFNGIRSSRKLAKQCVINKEVIWLLNIELLQILEKIMQMHLKLFLNHLLIIALN